MKQLLLFLFIPFILNAQIGDQYRIYLPDDPTPKDIYSLIKGDVEKHLKSYCQFDTIFLKERDEKVKKGKLNFLEMRTLKAKASNEDAFLKQSKTIFSTVVVGNNDAINNGSAFSYSHDKDKHKFSANMSFGSKNWSWTLIDVGTSISNPDDNFSYYSKGKWGNDIGVKLGINFRISTSQYFYDNVCDSISSSRYNYSYKVLAEIREAIELGIDSKSLQKKIKDLKGEYYKSLDLKSKPSSADDFIKEITKLDKQLILLKELEFLADPAKTERDINTEYRQDVKKIDKSYMDIDTQGIERDYKVSKKISKYVNKLMRDFDEKNNPFHGYSIWWLNANTNIVNSSFKIEGESLLLETIQEPYKSRLKSSVEFSVNMNQTNSKKIQFFKLYTSLSQHSYLDSPNLSGKILEVVSNDPINVEYYNVIDEEGEIVGRYDEIRSWKYSVNLGVYYANFFMFDKTLGLTGRVNLNAPAFHNQEMLYERNYSLMGGLIFRAIAEKKWSAATFAINAGVENQLFDQNGWDRFFVKASVGIPFSIFEKSKG